MHFVAKLTAGNYCLALLLVCRNARSSSIYVTASRELAEEAAEAAAAAAAAAGGSGSASDDASSPLDSRSPARQLSPPWLRKQLSGAASRQLSLGGTGAPSDGQEAQLASLLDAASLAGGEDAAAAAQYLVSEEEALQRALALSLQEAHQQQQGQGQGQGGSGEAPASQQQQQMHGAVPAAGAQHNLNAQVVPTLVRGGPPGRRTPPNGVSSSGTGVVPLTT